MLKSLLCVAALSVVWAGVRAAESVKFYLHIASQPLDAALQEFARQSGIQIVFFSKLTEGHQAPALEGEYTADAAMKALLTDSKLTFRVINSKTFQVSPMPVAGADESTPRAPVVGEQKVRVDDHTALEEVVISTAEASRAICCCESMAAFDIVCTCSTQRVAPEKNTSTRRWPLPWASSSWLPATWAWQPSCGKTITRGVCR